MKHYIVGMGNVGRAVSHLALHGGHEVVGAWTRSQEAGRAFSDTEPFPISWGSLPEIPRGVDIVWLTVPDASIPTVAAQLAAAQKQTGKYLLVHCSGATPCSVLRTAWPNVRGVASAHPLQAFTGHENDRSHGEAAWWYLSGEPDASVFLERVLSQMNVRTRTLDDKDRIAYHAAAVIASNGLVALASWAKTVMPGEDLEPLLPLMKGTLENLSRQGIHGSLTGPIARGDHEVLREHLTHIEANHPDLLRSYKDLSRTLLRLTQERNGADATDINSMSELLTGTKD